MNGLKNRIYLLAIALSLNSCSVNNSSVKSDDKYRDFISTETDIKAIRRAIGETEFERHLKYDFYLFYVNGGPFKVSYFYSLMEADSTLYSYTKYLDNIVSINMPPTFPPKEGLDSFFYSVTYQEHRVDQLSTLIKKMNQVGYWSNDVWDSFLPGEKVPYLFAYHKDKGEYWLRKNIYPVDFDNLVLRYIRDTFMRYSPEIDKKLYRLKIKL